jgi:hypothetical protein
MANKRFGVKELNILTGSGTPNITSPGNLNINANRVSISTDVSVGSNLSVSGVSTFQNGYKVTGNHSYYSDNVRLYFGNDSDIFIGHQTIPSPINYIAGDNNIPLSILSDNLTLGAQNGENFATFTTNGSASLYYDNSKKFETLGAGITVTGTTFTNNLSVSENVNVSGVLTASQIDGTIIGSIDNATNLTGGTANASSLNVSGIATISAGRIQADASSNLRFGNLPAGSGSGRNIAIGDQVLASLSGGQGRNIGIGELSYYDTTTGQYNIGIGERAGQKVSTGSYNVILGAYDGNSGNLDIRTSSNNVVIADGQGNIRQYINSSGNVGIKTTVVTEALTVAGVVSATSFYGTLNAGQLTGTLPAIDGSALLNVVGSGSGVIVQEDGSSVGTAGTINFGSNLSVSFASGIATVSATSDIAGINTSGTSTFNRLTVSGVSTFTGSVYTRNIAIDTGYNIKANNTGGTYHQLGGVQDWDLLLYKPRGTGPISDTSINISNGTLGTGGGSDLSVFKIYGDGGLRSYYHTISGGFAIQSERFSVTGGDSSGATPTEVVMKVGSGVTAYGSGVIYSTGSVTATSFYGSGANLTSLPAGQLTGALPAIDGSALLNVTASGTGVVVEDDQVNVGSATTIDFGTGLDVTFSAGIATITASGGSLQSRTVVTGVTTSIANNGIGNTNITGFKSYALMKVGLSTAGWLRLYTDSTSRANDASRSVGIDPAPGSGVIAEVVTTGISTTQIISPFVMGGNLDDPSDTTIYAAITNLSGSTQAITANLTILQLEA